MGILICDDHPVFAEALAELLVRRGLPVTAVTDHPAAALATLRQGGIRVGVLDVTFGTQPIFEYVPAMRTASPETRFMLLSGRMDADVIAAGQSADINSFCDKRQSANIIVAAIERVADGRTAMRYTPNPPALPATTQYARHLASYLTPRERLALSHLVRGIDTSGVARSLAITPATARSHIQHLLTKLGVHSRLEAVTWAVRSGLVDPQTGHWLPL